jgi:PAS domain-containing protein
MMSERRAWTEGMFVSSQHPEALTELDELASAYFSASNVGLCILDPGLHYIAINRELAKMNGVPAEDHLGRTVREILGEVADPIEKKISEVLEIRRPLEFEVSGKASLEDGKQSLDRTLSSHHGCARNSEPGWGGCTGDNGGKSTRRVCSRA